MLELHTFCHRFHFPNVFILYFTAVLSIYGECVNHFISYILYNIWLSCIFYFITGVFVVLPVFWSKDLLCSHDNLFIAIAESTTFCQIQGMCVLYAWTPTFIPYTYKFSRDVNFADDSNLGFS